MKNFNLFIIFLLILLYHTHTFSQTANQLTTVNNVSNYSNLNSINSPFKGNIAYVVEDSTIYQYDGNEWVHFCRDRVKNPFYLGKDTLNGIVAYIFKDENEEQHGFVVSKIETNTSWQQYQSPMQSINTNDYDGQQNTNNIQNSAAKNWILNNLGNDWFLPAQNQSHKIFQNLFHINPALENGGLTIIVGEYWTSTQVNPFSSWKLNMTTGVPDVHEKYFDNKVRAIKIF